MTDKRLDIVIDPTKAKSGGRVVRREIDDIGDSAVKTERRVGGMAKQSGRSLDRFGRSAKGASGAANGLKAASTGVARGLGAANVASLGAAAGFAALATAAVAAASALAGMAVAASLGLDRALTEVSTLSKNAKENIGLLKDEARSMAREFGGRAVDQVKAFYEAISAGAGTVRQSAALLKDANKLAVAGVTNVFTGVNVLTTAVNAYGKSVLSTAAASDAIFVAVQAGKTNVPELASALGNVIPIASSLGIEFDELVGSIAALTTQGQSTSLAVTGVRAILSTVAKPASEAAKLAKQLGIEFNTTALKSKGLRTFLQDIVRKTQGSKEALAQLFGSVEALNAVLAFSGGAGEKFNGIMDSMAAKAGATDAAFRTVADSLSKRYDRALAQIGDRLLDLGDRLLPLVVSGLELMAVGVDKAVRSAIHSVDLMSASFQLTVDNIKATFSGLPGAVMIGVLETTRRLTSFVLNELNPILLTYNSIIAVSNKLAGTNFPEVRLTIPKSDTVKALYSSLGNDAAKAFTEAQSKYQQSATIADMRFNGDALDMDAAFRGGASTGATEKNTTANDKNTLSLGSNSKARKAKISDFQKQRDSAKSAVDGLRQETERLRDQEAALGMTETAATAFLKAKQVIASLTRDGKTLSEAETAAIYAQAGAYAAANDNLKQTQDRISNYNAAVDFAKSTTKGFISDFKSGLAEGKSVWKSFGDAAVNALNKISDKLLDMAVNRLFENAFPSQGGAGGAGGIGGFLSNLLGGGGGSMMRGNFATLPSTTAAGLYHTGGTIGANDNNRQRKTVALDAFRNAPRHHSGMGLKADERPIIAETGEVMLSRKHVAAARRPMQDAGGMQGQHITFGLSVDGNGNLTPFVKDISKKQAVQTVGQAAPKIVDASRAETGAGLGNGSFDGPLSRYGVTPQARNVG